MDAGAQAAEPAPAAPHPSPRSDRSRRSVHVGGPVALPVALDLSAGPEASAVRAFAAAEGSVLVLDADAPGPDERALIAAVPDPVLVVRTARGPGALGASELRRAVGELLRRTGGSRIDVLVLTERDRSTPLDETLGAVGALVAAGAVGALATGPRSPEHLIRARVLAAQGGAPGLVAMQLPLSAARPLDPEVARTVRAQDMTLLPESPLLGDVLAGAATDRRSRSLRPLMTAVDRVAAAHGASAATVALARVLVQSRVGAATVRVRTARQVAEAVAAAALPLSRTDVAALDVAAARS